MKEEKECQNEIGRYGRVFPVDGISYNGYMKIDHLCVSAPLSVLEAEYLDVFGEHGIIGVPDHSLIVARVAV